MDRRRVMTKAQWFSAVTPGRAHHGVRLVGIVLLVMLIGSLAVVSVVYGLLVAAADYAAWQLRVGGYETGRGQEQR